MRLNREREGVREGNRRAIYHCLLERHGEALSRHDLCQATGLSHPTVGTILQEFGQLGICKPVGRSTARGGRPAQLIDFNAAAACVLAVDLSEANPRAALFDLAGRVLARDSAPGVLAADEDELFSWLGGLLDSWSAANAIGRLAVALPGVVAARASTVRYAPALGWHDYPLGAVLEEQFGYAVTLENDVNALATAELRFGAVAGRSSALFLALTTGVGMGVALDGRIYRGSHSAAGEIGYGAVAQVDRLANPSLNQPGQLEAHLQALRAQVVVDGHVTLTTSAARRAFAELATDLAVVLQNAVCLLDPELLVVSWPADVEHELVRELRERLSPPLPLEVVPVALGPEAALRGVAHLAIDQLEDSFTLLELPVRC
ncbi:MAG TPA: ROK family protein [Trueperaceae bacterium]|nr:ROK family protein [Trueperaceae bacterium]